VVGGVDVGVVHIAGVDDVVMKRLVCVVLCRIALLWPVWVLVLVLLLFTVVSSVVLVMLMILLVGVLFFFVSVCLVFFVILHDTIVSPTLHCH